MKKIESSFIIEMETDELVAGWTQASIQNYKGPTKEIVAGLAENVREKLGSTYTISESGTAGPTGMLSCPF